MVAALVDCKSFATPAEPFSPATSRVGYVSIFCVLLFGGYTLYRLWCCCCCTAKSKTKGACCTVPLHAHPILQLAGSVRYARGSASGTAALLRVGTTCHVSCYTAGPGAAGFTSTSVVRLRLLPGSHGKAATPSELDAPPPAGALTRALSCRLHPGLFTITAVHSSSAPDAREFCLASADGRQLQVQSVSDAAWSFRFPEALLHRAAPQDAPFMARGFAGRPWRRIAVGCIVHGLLTFGASSIEASTASALWQAQCRTWWERVLSRGMAVAVLLATGEYTLSVISPITVERLPRVIFKAGAALLGLVGLAFFLWGVIINATVGAHALGSAAVVWVWALVLDWALVWPLLLLLSAGLWHDITPLPEEHWPALLRPGGDDEAAAGAEEGAPATRRVAVMDIAGPIAARPPARPSASSASAW